MDDEDFKRIVSQFYSQHKRILPWRESIVPYHVLITEIMLQQTQVPRVLIKFQEFIAVFPDFKTLAESSLLDVLRVWQGLGYNRRGKYLHETARIIHHTYHDLIAADPELLVALPGIGPATARSIVTFVHNKPEIFIETNIRRVYIHHYFQDRAEIEDKDILPLVERTLDKENPREWYYALMDYGTDLGKRVSNPNRKSKHYSKQSRFEGSKRQVRGAILRELLKKNKPMNKVELSEVLTQEQGRVTEVLIDLAKENLIIERGGEYSIRE